MKKVNSKACVGNVVSHNFDKTSNFRNWESDNKEEIQGLFSWHQINSNWLYDVAFKIETYREYCEETGFYEEAGLHVVMYARTAYRPEKHKIKEFTL